MPHLVVLTGAGVSAESGIRTFRDTNGLWEEHRIEDVATPEAFARNPALVLDFYNKRRAQAREVAPNAAHLALAGFEEVPGWTVSIITQNVDDLHERAGSTHVLHLHGMLRQMRSVKGDTVYDCPGDIEVGDLAPDGGQLRPHIVWFGELVPAIEEAADIAGTADVLLVVGTSLQVYPAAGLLHYAPTDCPVYVIDPHQPEVTGRRGVRYVVAAASVGVPQVLRELAAQ
ncbi:MAG: NAD-dependent deacylase [Hymenobacter sp.]|nr:MAG: NAD-dependent deacylase [Hymenobacter sp.]